MRIRDFVPSDAHQLVEILKANQQYGHPEIDGPEAMLKVHECQAAEFLVAEEDYHSGRAHQGGLRWLQSHHSHRLGAPRLPAARHRQRTWCVR